MTLDAVLSFVRRGRARLEAIRFLKAAARGALWGGGLGVALLAAGKLLGGVPGWLPWTLLGAGAAASLGGALLRGRIGLAGAALFLDDRLATQQRITTLVTRETGPFAKRLLKELGDGLALPRLPFPREVSLVPAALFLLFVVGLLPDANGEPAARAVVAVPAAPAEGGSRPAPPDVRGSVARMADGRAPAGAELERVKAAIERGLHRPEDRRAAREALGRAVQGDAAAAKRVAGQLKALQGGAGRSEEPGGATPASAGGDGGLRAAAYPEHGELVRAYRRALLSENTR